MKRLNIIGFFKKRHRERMKEMYERHMDELRREASRAITIRNVKIEDDTVRPCLMINDIVAYISYPEDGIDLMSMMLHLRDTYVNMYKSYPTIKVL